MPMKITFELSDSDLDHFRKVMARSREASASLSDGEIIENARTLLNQVWQSETSDFICERMHRLETSRHCHHCKVRPASVDGGQILIHHGKPGAVAVQARPLLCLQFEELQHPHGVARRCHYPQLPIRLSEHQAGCVHLENFDATISEQCQKLNDVEIGD